MVKVPYFSYLQVKVTLYSRLSRLKRSAISADSYLNISQLLDKKTPISQLTVKIWANSQLSVDLHAEPLDKLQWNPNFSNPRFFEVLDHLKLFFLPLQKG